MTPVYEELPNWSQNIQGITDLKDLPKEAIDYIYYIENLFKRAYYHDFYGSRQKRYHSIAQPV